MKKFESESAMCTAFIEAVDPKVWTPYAETAGWDILLVRSDGFQIGVQAKLRFNIDVLKQVFESRYSWATQPGPDCRAVLVPETRSSFEEIAAYLGITVICISAVQHSRYSPVFSPYLPTEDKAYAPRDWHEWCPTERERLPAYVPDVVAGAPSPLQLTDWKIRAIKIAIILETRGHLTRADFKHIQIDHRRWLTPTGWLKVVDGRYVGDGMPDFKKQHPRVYEQIKAEASKWMPPQETKLL